MRGGGTGVIWIRRESALDSQLLPFPWFVNGDRRTEIIEEQLACR